MALFDDKILNPEERAGGFEAFDLDDQSFQIEKVGAYPGELPDIGQKRIIPLKEEIEEFDIDSLINAQSNQISTDNIQQNEFSAELDNKNENVGDVWQDWDNSINIDHNEDKDQEFTSELIRNSDVSLEDDSFESTGQSFENLDEDLNDINVVNNNAFLDQTFLQELANEIEKSKGRKKVTSENQPMEFEDMADKDKIDQFVPVEELGETETIDITAIDAVHPSSAAITMEQQVDNSIVLNSEITDKEKSNPHKEKPKKEKKEKTPKVKKEKPPKEKKERKPIPWKKLIIPGAALFLLLLIGGTIALVMNENAMKGVAKALGFNTDTTKVAKPKEHKIDEHKKVEHKAQDTTHQSVKHDTTHTVDTTLANKTEEKHQSEEQSHGVKEIKEKVEKVIEHKEEPKHKIEKPLKEAKKHEPVKHITKNAVTPSKSVEHKKKEDIAHETKKEKKSNINKESVKEKVEAKKIEKKVEQKPIITSIYTVEVYSSPSKEDAEEWLEKVRRKNLANANLTTYKVRDRIWYRIRFGKFETYDAARTAAQKSGFSQSRIDRIK